MAMKISLGVNLSCASNKGVFLILRVAARIRVQLGNSELRGVELELATRGIHPAPHFLARLKVGVHFGRQINGFTCFRVTGNTGWPDTDNQNYQSP